MPVVFALSSQIGFGCGVTSQGPGASAAAAASGASRGATTSPPTVPTFFQADVAPIAALAFREPFLWIGSDRGLRRVRLPAGEAEWVAAEGGFSGRRVSALAADQVGRILIATEAGIFRRSEVAGQGRYQAIAKLPNVTHLAPVTPIGASDAFWAGTSSGLFFVEGATTSAIDAVGRVAITSLDLDVDGKSVWVGARGRGLLRVDGRADGRVDGRVNGSKVSAEFGPGGADGIDVVDVIGTAVLPNGTRIAVGRAADGGTRLVLLRLDGPVVLLAQPDLPVAALVAGPRGPLVIGGPTSSTRAFSLGLVERGEVVEAGGIRFSPARKNLRGVRVAARPEARETPPEVTVAVVGGDDVFVGTRSMGVARLAAGGPDYLPAGELALGARSLSVACVDRSRCVVATGTGRGWLWDARAHGVAPIPDGLLVGGLTAVAGDGAATVYLVSGDGSKTIRIAKLSGDGAHSDPVRDVVVAMEGSPVVTFAALSPMGNLWMAVRDRLASGQEFGRGVIEVPLPAGRAIHHRPYGPAEKRPPEALPIAGDVSAVRFANAVGPAAGPHAIWFCTSMGVVRFAGGDLVRWGENEGLSEHCHDLEVAVDGTAWVATEDGPARFDGKNWRAWDGSGSRVGPKSNGTSAWPTNREGEAVAARALIAIDRGLWAGGARGVWPLTAVGRPIDRASGLIDDDVVDLVADRFGRLWVLGHRGLTMGNVPR